MIGEMIETFSRFMLSMAAHVVKGAYNLFVEKIPNILNEPPACLSERELYLEKQQAHLTVPCARHSR